MNQKHTIDGDISTHWDRREQYFVIFIVPVCSLLSWLSFMVSQSQLHNYPQVTSEKGARAARLSAEQSQDPASGKALYSSTLP